MVVSPFKGRVLETWTVFEIRYFGGKAVAQLGK